MTKIFDARKECCFSDRKILFDTNVWIAIYGNDPRANRSVYSDYYSSALKKNNDIIVNEYVIGEYFNRVCKIEYELEYEDRDFTKFKSRRKSQEFLERMESVRDTCLNIIDDCEYIPIGVSKSALSEKVTEAAKGVLDLSDSVMLHQCSKLGLALVSHDGDFKECGLDWVTANARVLKSLKS